MGPYTEKYFHKKQSFTSKNDSEDTAESKEGTFGQLISTQKTEFIAEAEDYTLKRSKS